MVLIPPPYLSGEVSARSIGRRRRPLFVVCIRCEGERSVTFLTRIELIRADSGRSLALDQSEVSGYCGVVSVHEPHLSIDRRGGTYALGFSGNDPGVFLIRMRNSP